MFLFYEVEANEEEPPVSRAECRDTMVRTLAFFLINGQTEHPVKTGPTRTASEGPNSRHPRRMIREQRALVN